MSFIIFYCAIRNVKVFIVYFYAFQLTCTRVIPGSQAAPHSLYLQSAEVVGINGERVL